VRSRDVSSPADRRTGLFHARPFPPATDAPPWISSPSSSSPSPPRARRGRTTSWSRRQPPITASAPPFPYPGYRRRAGGDAPGLRQRARRTAGGRPPPPPHPALGGGGLDALARRQDRLRRGTAHR